LNPIKIARLILKREKILTENDISNRVYEKQLRLFAYRFINRSNGVRTIDGPGRLGAISDVEEICGRIEIFL